MIKSATKDIYRVTHKTEECPAAIFDLKIFRPKKFCKFYRNLNFNIFAYTGICNLLHAI